MDRPLNTPIAKLNVYQQQWTIKASMVSKSSIRRWSNARGEGVLCSIELLDESGVDIRATLFNDAVDKFYNVLHVGSVYTISKGRLKRANKKYNTCSSLWEIILHQSSEINLCEDSTGECKDFDKLHQPATGSNIGANVVSQSSTEEMLHQEPFRGGGSINNNTDAQVITPIGHLNISSSLRNHQWTIKARVIFKSDIRSWSNAKGEGSLFSVELLDASGMDIRATIFKDAVDMLYTKLQVGSVYTISKGRLRVANTQYNTCKSRLELALDQNSVVTLCDDTGDIQSQSFDFVKIGQLESIEQGSFVDAIGIVQECSEVESMTSRKTGQELQKADVTIIDDTGARVRVTLWGQQAVMASQEMVVGEPVAFRRCRVSDYNGKSLNGPQSIFVNPDVPETQDLRDWWKSQGSRGVSVNDSGSAGWYRRLQGSIASPQPYCLF